jgi:hypothetical protein
MTQRKHPTRATQPSDPLAPSWTEIVGDILAYGASTPERGAQIKAHYLGLAEAARDQRRTRGQPARKTDA